MAIEIASDVPKPARQGRRLRLRRQLSEIRALRRDAAGGTRAGARLRHLHLLDRAADPARRNFAGPPLLPHPRWRRLCRSQSRPAPDGGHVSAARSPGGLRIGLPAAALPRLGCLPAGWRFLRAARSGPRPACDRRGARQQPVAHARPAHRFLREDGPARDALFQCRCPADRHREPTTRSASASAVSPSRAPIRASSPTWTRTC